MKKNDKQKKFSWVWGFCNIQNKINEMVNFSQETSTQNVTLIESEGFYTKL